MKRYLLFFIICIFFVFPLRLSAAEVGTMNSCDVDGKNKCGNGKGSANYNFDDVNCNGTNSVDIKTCGDTEHIPGKPECDDAPGKGFNIVIIIDKSGSMKGYAGGIPKVRMANNAVKKIIETYRDESPSSNVAAYTFCGNSDSIPLNSSKKGGFISVNDVTKWDGYITDDKGTPNSLCNGTFTQSGLKFAYTLLKQSKSDKIPVVFLITDGYPTVITTQFSVTNLGAATSRSLNPAPASYFYYNLLTLKDLKQRADAEKMNLKLYTVGIIDSSDTVATYLLNPTKENYNKLTSGGVNVGNYVSGDSNLSFATQLKNFLFKSGKYYDTVTSIGGTPDYGQSIGKVNEKERTITYTISQAWYNDLINKYHVPKSTKMCFSFSNSKDYKDHKNYIKNVYVNGKEVKYGSWTLSPTCQNNFCNLYYNISNSFKNGKVEVVIKVKDGINSEYIHDTSNYSKYTDFADDNNPVTNSVVGENYTEIINFISNSIDDSMKPVCKTTKGKDVPITLYSGVCKNININSLGDGDFYYKINNLYGNDLKYADQKKKVSVGDIVKVDSVDLPITVAGSAKFTFGKYDPVIYAGGGFNWTGTHVFNEYIWNYGLLSTESVPMFKNVKLKVYLNNKSYVLTNEVAITDICFDSECKRRYTVDALRKTVDTYLSNSNKLENRTEYFKSNVFKSVNSNDAYENNEENVYHNVTVLPKNFKFSNKNVKLDYSFSLYNACTRYDSKVTYRESNCNSNELFGGNLRYIPIKYFRSKAPIKVNSNISSYSGIKINVKGTCYVNVKQIAYDVPDGGCETGNDCKLTPAYLYRSIDHTNPFPKNVIPENWKIYMKDKNENDPELKRLKDSYDNNINYLYDGKFDFSSNSSDYTKWEGIGQNGISEFVEKNLAKGSLNNSNYCGLGVFKYSCNKVL